MARPACKFKEHELRNWNLVEHFRTVLLPRLKARPPTPTEGDPRRKLTADAYFSLFLLGMFNTTVTSMRGLMAATGFKKIKAFCPHEVKIFARFARFARLALTLSQNCRAQLRP